MHGIGLHALALTFILASQLAGEVRAQVDLAKQLIGTWRLVDIVDEKGKQTRGPNPTGYIHYDPSGIMSVQINRIGSGQSSRLENRRLSRQRPRWKATPPISAPIWSMSKPQRSHIAARGISIRATWAISFARSNFAITG